MLLRNDRLFDYRGVMWIPSLRDPLRVVAIPKIGVCSFILATPTFIAGILHFVQNDRLFDYRHVVNAELNNLLARDN